MVAYGLTIPECRDVNKVREMAVNTKAKDYVPKKIKVKLPGEEEKKDEPEPAAPEDEELIVQL